MPQDGAPFSILADFDNLMAAQDFVRRQAAALETPESLRTKLELVMEELFLNIVNHANPKTREDVEISCVRLKAGTPPEEMFCICVRDWGPSFNPLEKENPALGQDVESRPIGGLGVYLVTQMADYCHYAREKGSNLFTVCFHL